MMDKRNDELIGFIGGLDFNDVDDDEEPGGDQAWRSLLGETIEPDRVPYASAGHKPYDIDDEASGLFADSVESWVRSFLVPNYAPIGPALWCENWQAHPPAAYVFEGLWRAYEEARALDMANAGGQSNMSFYLGMFLPALDRITNPAGPFAHCHPDLCGIEPLFGASNPFGKRLT